MRVRVRIKVRVKARMKVRQENWLPLALLSSYTSM